MAVFSHLFNSSVLSVCKILGYMHCTNYVVYDREIWWVGGGIVIRAIWRRAGARDAGVGPFVTSSYEQPNILRRTLSFQPPSSVACPRCCRLYEMAMLPSALEFRQAPMVFFG